MKTKKMLSKLLHVICILLLIFILDNPMSAKDHLQSIPANASDMSAGKWHPKMFYIELPGLSMSFMLPDEPGRSGVHNLLFISKESGETLLLDTIKENKRYFTPFSPGSCYDVTLLYNNSTYVRCNEIILENGIEVDMRNQPIQPSDATSEHWEKTLRAFDYAIIDREPVGNERSPSGYMTKGYVFSNGIGKGEAWGASVYLGDKQIETTADGYFEIENKEDTEQTLLIGATLHSTFEKSNIIANCGLVVVLPDFGRARRVPR
ncbi:hypothetical protein SDC9_135033 [bioreactor metagenome]|uniref:Uncharacterized protein n=2 Tax=root TaxID=1 RepID=A0A645DH67_9ZZZZ